MFGKKPAIKLVFFAGFFYVLSIYLSFSSLKFSKLKNFIDYLSSTSSTLLITYVLLVLVIVYCVSTLRKQMIYKNSKNSIIVQHEPPQHLNPLLVGHLIDGQLHQDDLVAAAVMLTEKGYVSIRKGEIELKIDIGEVSNKLDGLCLQLFFAVDAQAGDIVKISDIARSDEKLARKASIIWAIDRQVVKKLKDDGFYQSNKSIQLTDIRPLLVFCVLIYCIYALSYILFDFSVTSLILYIMAGFLLLLAVFVSNFHNLTRKGEEAASYLLGFKEYLETVESSRFYFHGKYSENLLRDVKFLSFAIALGVVEEWEQSFAPVVSEGKFVAMSNTSPQGKGYKMLANDFYINFDQFSKGLADLSLDDQIC